ncbi:MAG: hypothetical protein ACK40O_13560 [Allosphingosinicella sp.]
MEFLLALLGLLLGTGAPAAAGGDRAEGVTVELPAPAKAAREPLPRIC